LKSNSNLMITIFIQALVVSRGEAAIIEFYGTIRTVVIVSGKTNTPGIIGCDIVLQNMKIDRSGIGNECIVDGRPLVSVISCDAIAAKNFTGKAGLSVSGEEKNCEK